MPLKTGTGPRLVGWARTRGLPPGCYTRGAPHTAGVWAGAAAGAVRWSPTAGDHPAYLVYSGWWGPRWRRRWARPPGPDGWARRVHLLDRPDLDHHRDGRPGRPDWPAPAGRAGVVDYPVRDLRRTEWARSAYTPPAPAAHRDELFRWGWTVAAATTAVDPAWGDDDAETVEFGHPGGGYPAGYLPGWYRPAGPAGGARPAAGWTHGYLVGEPAGTPPPVEWLVLGWLGRHRAETVG